MQDTKYLFTFIVDFEGGTYCSQIKADSLNEAIDEYKSFDPFCLGAQALCADPVEVQNTVNLWCCSGVTGDDKLIIANIVLTDLQKSIVDTDQ